MQANDYVHLYTSMHANAPAHCCMSMSVFLCRSLFSKVRCQGICPVTLLLDDGCSACCCSLIALTEALQSGHSSSPGCGARENKESSWTGFTASVNEINWLFFRLLLLRGSSYRMKVETWQLLPQQEKKKGEEDT